MLAPKFYNHRQHINSTNLLWDRQNLDIDGCVRRRLQASPAFIDRLEQESVLRGHEGCVNCLEWTMDGRLLASGSDDFHVIIWDPFQKRRVHGFNTKHLGNMFSVKFLPRHNNSVIATCAADKYIFVFDINNRRNDTLFSCHCHDMRVKRLATAPDSAYVFWSAGEDGKILQLDMREQHRCRCEDNRVRLVNLTTYLDSNAEAKCIAVNPRRTEYIAVGSNDPYARLYDRRMLRPVSTFPSSLAYNAMESIPKDCVTYFCPGHINKNNSRIIEHESRAITYLTFNAAGTELLVNMGCEHVYLYDLLNAEQATYLSLPEYIPPTSTESQYEYSDNAAAEKDEAGDTTACNTLTGSAATGSKRHKLPEHIEHYKKLGNEFLENEKYLRAIEQYSEAIALWPECSVMYLNRATAYMRRLWFGDVYAALRDCHQALRLDPAYIKAHFRLARALLELGRPQDAEECLKELIQRFPSYATNHGVLMLYKDIRENRQSTQQSQQQQQQQQQSHQSQQTQSQQPHEQQQPPHDEFTYLKISDEEYSWRSKAKDFSRRYVGHCNTTTDIKEANYFGYDGDFIVAGSDDGNFFIWERASTKIRAVYRADSAIVNCVQPHPDICMMATSGIDHDIKIWSPIASTADERPNLISYIDKTVEDNQQKMKTDPFDLNTRNAFCWNG